MAKTQGSGSCHTAISSLSTALGSLSIASGPPSTASGSSGNASSFLSLPMEARSRVYELILIDECSTLYGTSERGWKLNDSRTGYEIDDQSLPQRLELLSKTCEQISSEVSTVVHLCTPIFLQFQNDHEDGIAVASLGMQKLVELGPHVQHVYMRIYVYWQNHNATALLDLVEKALTLIRDWPRLRVFEVQFDFHKPRCETEDPTQDHNRELIKLRMAVSRETRRTGRTVKQQELDFATQALALARTFVL